MLRKILLPCLLILASTGYGQLNTGDQVPTFFLRTLEGESFFLSRKVGPNARPNEKGPLVLDFFATWCVPCKAEIPHLHQLQKEFPEVHFYLIDVSEPQDLVRDYKEQLEVELPILLDLHGVAGEKFGVVDENKVAHLPATFIIDIDGKLFYSHQGYRPGDEEIYRRQLAALVAGEPPVEVEHAPGEMHAAPTEEPEEESESED